MTGAALSGYDMTGALVAGMNDVVHRGRIRRHEPAIQVVVEGVRTRLPSGEETAVTVRGEVRPGHPDSIGLGADDLYLYLIDGPTGWESAPICRLLDDLAADPDSPGWLACFGTPNSWARLVVTRDSLLALAATVATVARTRETVAA